MVPPSVTPEPRTPLGDRLRLLALHLIRDDGLLCRFLLAFGFLREDVWALLQTLPRAAALALRRATRALRDGLRVRHAARHPVVATANVRAQAQLSLLDHVALLVTERVGTFGFFLLIAAWTVLWLAWNFAAPIRLRFDPAPAFVFWLFISNLIQICLMPLLMVGQNLQARASETRTETDHELALATAAQIDALKIQVWAMSRDLSTLARALGAAPTAGSAPGNPLRASMAPEDLRPTLPTAVAPVSVAPSPADTQPAPQAPKASKARGAQSQQKAAQ